MKEVVTMANKKTVVQMYEEILAIPTLTAEQKAFIEKRIEITQKKNANRGNGEPTPKQKEKMAADAEIEDAVVGVMVEGATYTASDLVKMLNRADVPNTQKLTPRLTALVEANKVVKSTVKGRTNYALPSVDEGEGEDE
jgi:CRISPR/Cas system-associated endonuclease Cas3-HD